MWRFTHAFVLIISGHGEFRGAPFPREGRSLLQNPKHVDFMWHYDFFCESQRARVHHASTIVPSNARHEKELAMRRSSWGCAEGFARAVAEARVDLDTLSNTCTLFI